MTSIIIPVFNSENTLRQLYADIKNCFSENYELILINDGSSDGSGKICRELAEEDPDKVIYVELMRNFGEHNALMAGLNYASGDWIITMDDDLQNPAREAAMLADFAYRSDFDVIYTKYSGKKHNWGRNLGSSFNNFIANIMLRKPNGLYLCSFKAISRKVVEEIIRYDLPYPYLDGIILNITGNIGVLGVEHKLRKSGRSGYTLRKLIHLWSSMFTNFSILPLRIATFSGFTFSFLGFIMGLITIIEKMINPELPLGYASMFVALSFFSGIILMALGLLGEYIGRIFIGLNKTPQYVIRRIYRNGSTYSSQDHENRTK